MPIAFSVWDGLSRERGNRRGLTLWYSLYVEPEVVPSPAGPMAKTALIILAIELALIWWVRRRYGSRRQEQDGQSTQPVATELGTRPRVPLDAAHRLLLNVRCQRTHPNAATRASHRKLRATSRAPGSRM